MRAILLGVLAGWGSLVLGTAGTCAAERPDFARCSEQVLQTWCREELARLAVRLTPAQREGLIRTAERLAELEPDALNRRSMDRAAVVAEALARGAASRPRPR